jgi:7-carboxy-7-deazaguanine synthase
MSQPTFLINEIFPSIEGETSFQGQLMLFVRFTGCNLRCSYCDTTYAYSKGDLYTLEQLLEQILHYNLKIIHLTGGEPLLQQHLSTLIRQLTKKGKTILIETNGSVNIKPYIQKNTHIMLDVKTPGSNEAYSFLKSNISLMRTQDEFKFVITDKKDYLFAKEFVLNNNLIEKNITVNFSPALPQVKPAHLSDWIVKDKLTVRFNLQIHKYIWPDIEKGV